MVLRCGEAGARNAKVDDIDEYTEVFGHEPDLQKMMKGDPVKHLQQLLDNHCYGPEPDGFFGDITERCLNLFKGGNGMLEDGLVDQATWAVLNAPPRIIARQHGPLSKSGNVLYWGGQQRRLPDHPGQHRHQFVLGV